MTIRLATISDSAAITELAITTMREAFGPPHNPVELVEEYVQSAMSVPIMEAELADHRSTFFLLESGDGELVGYAKLRKHAPPRKMADRNAIEIQRIYLLQNQIGQGQGRILMQHCLDWSRNQGYTAVWLGVWERNARAMAFYEKIGFRKFGFHYFQFGTERQRDFWLEKQLDN
ncbi:GNAT family N-acetyltransferase [Spirosoma foliorum]|uniref:GNAT family N-acetyltransferase n=1 Tax=Spirosoma foliorum TaxID=2710596 RepID=A0A7G5GQB4_9BACT|nr:GNAT family N-acetyltransferase [Spirosoma foliorum]QMW01056.1 GNAT family N-acetyltransferase [Spirosoma foliorum]